MDSGTSGGSMQSVSSGGEDDQNDTGSFSAVSRLHRSNPNLHHQPYFSPQQQQQQLLQFPPLTNNLFFDTLPQSDLDGIWASGVTRHPPPPQPLHQEQEHHHYYQQQQQQQQQKLCSASSLSSSFLASSSALRDPQPKPPGRASSGKEAGSGSSGRVVKKRTRASRKTPTTVLTTDPANFRAMVQEFTGIPTPPFAPSPFFPAKNFDLFGGGGPNSPSLGSLLYSLSNPPHSFAPPSSINADANNNVASSSFQDEQTHQQMAMMMMRRNNNTMSSSPSTLLGQNPNPNPGAFQLSSAALRPPFPSFQYPSRGGENNQ